jgi:hypothetical protein
VASARLVLAREPADSVAAVLGEALAVRAGRTEDPGERRRIAAALLARAGDDGLDGYRFRMEDDLERVALEAARGDPDGRVAARAAELRKDLDRK